jgi:hypothetical protein
MTSSPFSHTKNGLLTFRLQGFSDGTEARASCGYVSNDDAIGIGSYVINIECIAIGQIGTASNP